VASLAFGALALLTFAEPFGLVALLVALDGKLADATLTYRTAANIGSIMARTFLRLLGLLFSVVIHSSFHE
jgi:hypothetical protein